MAIDLDNLAQVHVEMGQFAQALPLYQRSLAIAEKSDWPDLLAHVLLHLGKLNLITNRPAEAMPLLTRALSVQKSSDPGHFNVTLDLAGVAEAHLLAGRTAEAEPLFQEAVTTAGTMIGAGHPWIDEMRDGLARTYFSAGQIDKALDVSRSAVHIITDRLKRYAGTSSALELNAVRPYLETSVAILRAASDRGRGRGRSGRGVHHRPMGARIGRRRRTPADLGSDRRRKRSAVVARS